MKKKEFIHIARLMNKQLNIVPLLFGSLGLEQRLSRDLNADDIDVLIPGIFLNERWGSIVTLMNDAGYTLSYDGIGINYLLDLHDYLKVYTASSKDGYRKNVKNKQDEQKIELIKTEIQKNSV